MRVDSREILAATSGLIARLGELEVDTHIVVTTRYIQRGAPNDFLVDLTKGGFVRALYARRVASVAARISRTCTGRWSTSIAWKVQFEGFNAITGKHDPVLASMSRLYTDLVFYRQIRLRRGGGAYVPAIMGARRRR